MITVLIKYNAGGGVNIKNVSLNKVLNKVSLDYSAT